MKNLPKDQLSKIIDPINELIQNEYNEFIDMYESNKPDVQFTIRRGKDEVIFLKNEKNNTIKEKNIIEATINDETGLVCIITDNGNKFYLQKEKIGNRNIYKIAN